MTNLVRLRALAQQWKERAAGSLSLDASDLIEGLADELDTVLSALERQEDIAWVGLNAHGQVIGCYRTKEQAEENTQYIVGCKMGDSTGSADQVKTKASSLDDHPLAAVESPSSEKCAYKGCQRKAERRRSYCAEHWSGSWLRGEPND